jgi:hypothetical protein
MDWETASDCDLKVHGALRYARDPSTRPLMLGWAFDDSPVEQLVFPDEKPEQGWAAYLYAHAPDVYRVVTDKGAIKVAHNCQFEKLIFEHVLGMKTDIEQWEDTMVMAYQLALPGDLKTLSKCIGIKGAEKDARGKKLITLFCKPRPKSRVTEKKPHKYETRNTYPEDWAVFCEYNIQDVVAERMAYNKMRIYDVPAREREVWLLDQKINERGMPVDLDFVRAAWAMVQRIKKKKLGRIAEITGLSNPGAWQQVLPWLKKQGTYPFQNMKKESVRAALQDFKLDEKTYAVLDIWQYVSKTSLNKYKQMLDIQVNGWMCFCYQYGGAQRTLRWAGRKPQFQNLPSRFAHKWKEHLAEVRQLILDGDEDSIEILYGDPAEALVACVRTAVKAPDGYSVVCADLGSIESRGLGEISKCQKIVATFEAGRDLYRTFGVDLLHKLYDAITDDERQWCKPPVLGSGFGLGAGGKKGEYPLEEYYGLIGYAKGMGVTLTQEQAQHATDVFRSKYVEVPNTWYALEDAAVRATRTKKRCRAVAKHPKTGDYDSYPLDIWFDVKGPFLRMELPSGRYLYYLRPKLRVEEKVSKSGRKYSKTVLSYEGYDENKRWTRVDTWGGKFIENACQGWARDILAEGMMLAAKKGFIVVGSVHDELITLVKKQAEKRALGLLIDCMSHKPDWHKGIVLGAAGFYSPYYKK